MRSRLRMVLICVASISGVLVVFLISSASQVAHAPGATSSAAEDATSVVAQSTAYASPSSEASSATGSEAPSATGVATLPVSTPTSPAPTPTMTLVPSPTPFFANPRCDDIDRFITIPMLPTLAQPPAGGWKLVFHDEFDGQSLDDFKWTTHFWWGTLHGDEELQRYTRDNVIVSDGLLRLRAREQQGDELPYASGMISSHGKFSQKYGYFEIRARVPKGKGLWPAFWLLPDVRRGVTWPPEIDVVEVLGDVSDKVHLTYHYLNEDGDYRQAGVECTAVDFSEDFHTYAIEWTSTSLVWYIDGYEYARTEKSLPPPDVPMYVIANLAVGGWAGDPDAATKFPSYFDIDYIRVYAK